MQPAYAVDLAAELADRDKRAKIVSHCVNDEKVIFTCKIKAKTVSVCAVFDNEKKLTKLKYKYGLRHHIEMQIIKTAHSSFDDVTFANVPTASSIAYVFRIKNIPYDYYLYSTSVRGQDDPKTGASTRENRDGLAVKKGSVIIFNKLCSTTAFDHNLTINSLVAAVKPLEITDESNPYELAYPSTP